MNKIRIIIVDNYKLFRKSLRLNFETRYPNLLVVGEAESGIEFFGLLENISIDIVLLDVGLPDISGVDIARLLKNERPEVKIIVITADTSSSTIEEMFRIGVEGFIHKNNINGETVADAIYSVMQGIDYFGSEMSNIISRTYIAIKKTTEVTAEFTEHEKNIIKFCHEGLKAKQIADHLGVTPKTVEWYKYKIFEKLGIHSTYELIQYVVKNGIL